MPIFIESLQEIVHEINTLSHKIATYRDDWASLPAAVKNALKNAAVNKLNEQKTSIDTVITEIQGL